MAQKTSKQPAKKKPMSEAEIQELEQELEDNGYRVTIMTNTSDAERKKAFEAALEKAKKNHKDFEEIWEGSVVTLWVKSDK